MRGSQRGATSVEVVLLVPIIMVLLAVAVAGWRIGWARSYVNDAASAAARAASLQTYGTEARYAAEVAARSDLQTTDVVCETLTITTDVSDFSVPSPASAEVSVEIVCRVRLSDVAVSGLPGAVTIRGHATEVLDSLRRRHP